MSTDPQPFPRLIFRHGRYGAELRMRPELDRDVLNARPLRLE
jgi:hypothetical protein